MGRNSWKDGQKNTVNDTMIERKIQQYKELHKTIRYDTIQRMIQQYKERNNDKELQKERKKLQAVIQ